MKNLSTFGRQILKSIVITIVAGVMLYLLWALRISGESMVKVCFSILVIQMFRKRKELE